MTDTPMLSFSRVREGFVACPWKKWGCYATLGLTGGAGVLAVLAYVLFQRAEPDHQGLVTLTGLEHPVSVIRDSHAIPTLWADNDRDAAHVLGYLHASERFFQMEMQRRAGQGRLAEAIGDDGLAIDRFIRTLGLYARAEKSFESYDPDVQEVFKAYAAGVNDWLSAHKNRLPPEFLVLGLTPEPWRVADSLVWQKLMALQLSQNYAREMLRGQIYKQHGSAVLRMLFPDFAESGPVTLAPQSLISIVTKKESDSEKTDKKKNTSDKKEMKTKDKPVSPPASSTSPSPSPKTEITPLPSPPIHHAQAPTDQLAQWIGLRRGASNEWVIAGARTETGKPILANDPHLELGVPILWYLAQTITPHGMVKGATVPGLPITLLGQNDHIAWGMTTTNSDVADLFIETLDPKDPHRVMTGKDRSEAFITHDEVIRVKGGRDQSITVRETRHGPVLSDVVHDMADYAGEGRVMALSFTALGNEDTTPQAIYRLNHAKNWKDFWAALAFYQAPPQNIVYADRDGHIGFVNAGIVPVRKKGDGAQPVDGASGVYDWRGFIPMTAWPHSVDPKAGFFFNANNTVTNRGLTTYDFGHEWDESFRARRLQHWFDTTAVHSLSTSTAMQNDHLSAEAAWFKPYLANVTGLTGDDEAARQAVLAWDGFMRHDTPEPLVFAAWLHVMHQHLFSNKAGERLVERGPFMADSLLTLLGQQDKAWCGGDGCSAFVAARWKDSLTYLRNRHGPHWEEWRWGDEHKAAFVHKLYSHIPILSALSDLTVPSDGGYYTLDRGGGDGTNVDHPFAREQGGGYRAVYDLSQPDASRFMIATGQSGHILSPHYRDLRDLWNTGGFVTMVTTQAPMASATIQSFLPAPGHEGVE